MIYRVLILISTVLCIGCSTASNIDLADASAANLDLRVENGNGSARSPSNGWATGRSAIGGGRTILFYFPNRVFDLLDIVRFRVRVGPGFALGARATKPASAFLGFYNALWVGIPGPRNEPKLSLPLGAENRTTAQASVVEVGATGGVEYGPAEIGLDIQVALVGLAVGVEPWDALDFLAGLILLDPRGDDL